jgi:hypothetical protein
MHATNPTRRVDYRGDEMAADISAGTAFNGNSTCAEAQGKAEIDRFLYRHFRPRA